jgi:hypothetical protein
MKKALEGEISPWASRMYGLSALNPYSSKEVDDRVSCVGEEINIGDLGCFKKGKTSCNLFLLGGIWLGNSSS